METSLHRQLKGLYADSSDDQEVEVDGYRIDAIAGGQLIEIQFGSLGAIRGKVRHLLTEYEVCIVKPLADRKYLIKHDRSRSKVLSKRYSPARENFYHLFLDLVHFVDIFPHPRLTLEILLTEQEEHRIPQRRRRWRSRDYHVVDRTLRDVVGHRVFRSAEDLAEMLPEELPPQFTTADIADGADIPRWLAQKMAYCLRKIGVISTVDKQGNSLLYERNLCAEFPVDTDAA